MIARLFTDHPAHVDETYLEHARFASRTGLILLGAAGAAFVHAIIPGLFEKTASRMIGELNAKMHTRR